MPQVLTPPEIRERDILWLKALLASISSDFDLRVVQRIVTVFNTMRDEQGAP
jgi:hypothetical protein